MTNVGVGIVGPQPLLVVGDRLDQHGARTRDPVQPRRHVVEQRAVAGADIDHLERPSATEPRLQRRLGQEGVPRSAGPDRACPWEGRARGRCAPGRKRSSSLSSGAACGAPPAPSSSRRPHRHERGRRAAGTAGSGWGNRCGCRGSGRPRTLPAPPAPARRTGCRRAGRAGTRRGRSAYQPASASTATPTQLLKTMRTDQPRWRTPWHRAQPKRRIEAVHVHLLRDARRTRDAATSQDARPSARSRNRPRRRRRAAASAPQASIAGKPGAAPRTRRRR